MLVTQKAVRVYKSAAYSGAGPNEEPITMGSFLLDESAVPARAVLYLGNAVSWVQEASRIRQVVGNLILNWLRGVPVPQDIDSAIEKALPDAEATERWQDGWYVTIVVEQDFDVQDDAVAHKQFVWLSDDYFERARRFKVAASPYLDRFALVASTVISPDAFEKVVIPDHVYFASAGKRTFGVPEPRMTAQAQVTRILQAGDVRSLEDRLRASGVLAEEGRIWLDIVAPWWLSGLREPDPWKAYMQLFTGLELLHEYLVKRYYDRVVNSRRVHGRDIAGLKATPVLDALLDMGKTKISSRNDLSPHGEFAVVALALFPQEADADFDTFVRIKRLRNAVAHGDQTIEETTFPVVDLRELLCKYIGAAIREHQSGETY